MNDTARKIVDRLKRFRQQDAVNLIESQATEIKQLKAIMEEWPKTADGVTMFLGMVVYILDEYKSNDLLTWHVVGFDLSNSCGNVIVKQSARERSRVTVYHNVECYSTRAAAEAAKEGART